MISAKEAKKMTNHYFLIYLEEKINEAIKWRDCRRSLVANKTQETIIKDYLEPLGYKVERNKFLGFDCETVMISWE